MVTVALDRDKRDENASVSVKRGRVTPPGGHERLSIMEGQAARHGAPHPKGCLEP
jgi:hypothetical protein